MKIKIQEFISDASPPTVSLFFKPIKTTSMQKTILLLLTIIIFSNGANCQITKGNWLVGGTGSFSSQFERTSTFNANGTNINLSPEIGYFFIDKFVAGVMPTYSHSKVKYLAGAAISHQVSVGPFIRYYFLQPEKIVNIFGGVAYQYGVISNDNASASQFSNTFKFTLGTVAYFNSSVGIELAANYEIFNAPQASQSANTFALGIGFQIHLKKDK